MGGALIHPFSCINYLSPVKIVFFLFIASFLTKISRAASSADVQRIIDEVEFKDRDHCVNKLLEVLRRGDAAEAQAIFMDIIARQKSDFPRMNPAAFQTYLINVNSEVNGEDSIGNAIKKLKSCHRQIP